MVRMDSVLAVALGVLIGSLIFEVLEALAKLIF